VADPVPLDPQPIPADGGPAFPQMTKLGDFATSEGGASLRDLFAMGALAGIALTFDWADGNPDLEARAIAAASYKLADAMLAEREAAARG